MLDFLKRTFVNRDVAMKSSDWLVDVVIAIGVFGVSLAQLTLLDGLIIPDSFTRKILGIDLAAPNFYDFIAIGAASLPLIFRRKYSWAAFIVCLLAWVSSCCRGNDSVTSIVPLLISLVTLCAMRPMEDAFVAALMSFLAVGFLPSFNAKSILTNLMLVQNMSLVFAGAGVGVAFKTTRDLIRSAEMRVKQTEEAAKATTEKRLEEERVAIARELHDITAHSLSAISIQAAAAEAQLEKSPDEAKKTVVGIRKIAKESLAEIRRMIGVLREPAEGEAGLELAPSMGTEELSEIEEYLQNAGVNCEVLRNNYEKEMVPGFVDIAVFGICREAATNIVKHAHAKNVNVCLSVNDVSGVKSLKATGAASKAVFLTIKDDGVGLSGDVNATDGHGVEGMRERCVALGGTFEIKNGSDAGTEIDVVIPIQEGEE